MLSKTDRKDLTYAAGDIASALDHIGAGHVRQLLEGAREYILEFLMSKPVERETYTGAYDQPCERIIIDHSELGRIMLSREFVGMDELRGGAYRWATAYQLQPGDTLEELDSGDWNDSTSLLQAVEHGADDTRPALDWSSEAVRELAEVAS